MPVVAETFRDNSKRLVGRGFVDDYVATIDGPREELKIRLADERAGRSPLRPHPTRRRY